MDTSLIATSSDVLAFNAIKHFLNDLWNVFGNKSSEKSFGLYMRLLVHITPEDKDKKGMLNIVNSFRLFISENESYLDGGKIDKVLSNIVYNGNERIYVNIQKYYSKADDETKDAIKKHLLTISAILFPKEETFNALERDIDALGFDRSTPEGRYISDAMKSFSDMGDIKDPQQAIAMMMTSGTLHKLFFGLSEKFQSGELNKERFQTTVMSTLGMLSTKMSEEGGDPQALMGNVMKMMGAPPGMSIPGMSIPGMPLTKQQMKDVD